MGRPTSEGRTRSRRDFRNAASSEWFTPPIVPRPADRPRVAVVTGGSRGIGRETAGRLAADGYAVVVGYAGNRDLAEAAVKGVTAAGGRAIAVQADVADEEQAAAPFAVAGSEFGGVDVVVHAAGRMHLSPVAPGPTATDLFLDSKDERTIAELAAQSPLERLGTSADIAEVVAFLASPAGHWVNGQVVRANGGIV